MKNYERMIECNHAASREKINRAIKEINLLLEREIQVSVSELVHRTGLSRGFFYKNEEVSKALERAKELQNGKKFVRPQQVILNKAMERQLVLLERRMEKMQKENEKLRSENEKLQKALKKQDLRLIKSL